MAWEVTNKGNSMKHGSYRYVDTSLCEDGSIGGWNYTAKSEVHEQNDLTFISFFGIGFILVTQTRKNIKLHVFFHIIYFLT